MYLEFEVILNIRSLFLNARKILLSEEKLPMCGCAQSHMYKVAYVLPLISELFIRVCVCVCVYVCVRACVCVCVCVCVY